MNRSEFKVFTDRLFTAFPGLLSNINSSLNPKGTLETWYTSLASVDASEANWVLDSWLSGSREPPKAFERDYVAIMIRSLVARRRSDQSAAQSKYQVARSLHDEKLLALKRREQYESPLFDMQDPYEIASKAWRRHLDGEISHAEYNQICEKACRQKKQTEASASPIGLSLFPSLPGEAHTSMDRRDAS